MNAILVENLKKSYGPNLAVDGISFAVERGEIFGMLGPNGAGKTTTVEILEGLRSLDSGRVELLGMESGKTNSKLKEQVGVALQSTTLYPNLTSFELIEMFGTFFKKSVDPDRLLESLGLSEKRNSLTKTLSGGQQQRLAVALALVNDPQLVFLDEPTTGLDPQARRSLWEVIEGMKEAGKTVFLTTHYMDEAEHLCDRIAIMDHGKILAMDTPQNLVASEFPERAIQFEAPAECQPSDFDQLTGVTRSLRENTEIVLYSQSVQKTLAALMDHAERNSIELGDIHLRRATLEDVFLKLTGRSMRD
ncbi:MAG: ABC transporter ATP-binding protein [Chthonomonadales bacterium]